MRKFIGITFYILFLTGGEEAANKDQKLTETEKLAATAKVWGFLKYYHPEVAKGTYDWDEQLFNKLAEVENCHSKSELSDLFLNWIEELGEIPKLENTPEDLEQNLFNKNFDLSWIESGMFSRKLEKKLRFIEKNRFRGDPYYVKAADQVGNAVFTNEKEYNNFTWEEKNLRLLALFRYWNQVEYFFPYKYQMDEDWDEVLNNMLPHFLNPNDELDFHLAMQELVVNLDDSHAYLITQLLNNRTGLHWVPVKLQMIGDKAVVSDYMDRSLAEKDNWKLGDIVVEVNDVQVSEILEIEEKYLSGSNLVSKYREIHIPLLNGNTDSVEVDILRDGKLIKKTVSRYYKRQFRPDTSAKKWKLINKNIGYADLVLLEREDVDEMFEAFRNTNGIILDVRNHPRGTWYGIATHLHRENFDVGKSLIPEMTYPGKFKFTEPFTITHTNPEPYEGKVVLLINEYAQSEAEYTVMALENAPTVTTIGRPTSGANGNVTDISFVGEYTTYMSGLGVFYPDGRETQRKGLTPDIRVDLTVQGFKEGKDEILNRALEFLKDEN